MSGVTMSPVEIQEFVFSKFEENPFLRNHYKDLYREGILDVKPDAWIHASSETQNIKYDKSHEFLIINDDTNHVHQFLTRDIYGFSIWIDADKKSNYISVVRYNETSGEIEHDLFNSFGTAHSFLTTLDFASYAEAVMAYNLYNMKFIPDSLYYDYRNGFRFMVVLDSNEIYHLVPVVSNMRIKRRYDAESCKVPNFFQLDYDTEICKESGIHQILCGGKRYGYIQFTIDNNKSFVRIVSSLEYGNLLLTSFKYKSFESVKKFVDSHSEGELKVFDLGSDLYSNRYSETSDDSVYTFSVRSTDGSGVSGGIGELIGTYFYEKNTGYVYRSVPKARISAND